MGFSIANLTEQDIKAASISYAKAFSSVDSLEESWSPQAAENFLRFMLKLQPDLFFIVKDGENFCGGIWALVRPFYNGNNLVDIELFVDPAYQRKGLSKLLYVKLLETALEKYNVVEMEGLADSKADFPLNYYKKMGRKESGLVHITGDPREVLNFLKSNN